MSGSRCSWLQELQNSYRVLHNLCTYFYIASQVPARQQCAYTDHNFVNYISICLACANAAAIIDCDIMIAQCRFQDSNVNVRMRNTMIQPRTRRVGHIIKMTGVTVPPREERRRAAAQQKRCPITYNISQHNSRRLDLTCV